MSRYRVDVRPHATRAIRKLSADGRRRVQAIVELLADDPRPPAAKQLTGRPEWRVRSGDYRVLYLIEDGRLLITVVAAGRRDTIYR